MYVAVKGGQEAIEAAHRLLAEERRGDPQVPEISVVQIEEQLALAVDRVMGEASLYDRQLAALAIKQAWGDMIEAVFLLRAFRTTLPRLGSTLPIDIAAMTVRRRVSATFKDLPGGQILGATFDYTHRLLNVDLAQASGRTTGELAEARVGPEGITDRPDEPDCCGSLPRVMELLEREGLIEAERPGDESRGVGDLTREPLTFPAGRDVRLQSLALGPGPAARLAP